MFLHAIQRAQRHCAHGAQARDHRLHQHIGRRGAGGQAHARFAVQPFGLQFVGVVHHMGVHAQFAGQFG